MEHFRGQTVLITGAASGMGASHARGFAAEGANVVVADVNEERGQAIADELGPGTDYIPKEFVPRIGGAIKDAKIRSFGPETVPPFEQLEPTQIGAFQFLYTHTAYHFGTTRVAFGADAIDGDQRREAGIWDTIDRQYQKKGVKLIAMITVPGGFHIQVRKPLVNGRFDGLSIRGTQVYSSIVQYLGGKLVILPIGEVYSALERGVVDGAASPIIGTLSLRFNEIAKHYVRPRFATSTTYLFMNLASYNSLSKEEQEALLKLGLTTEVGAEARMRELIVKEEEGLKATGSTEAKIAPDLAAGLKKIWADGLFAASAETDPEAAGELRAIARKAKLVE